jgi:hypothetical protein
MARPICRQHPHGRVRRDGYYGKHRERRLHDGELLKP